MEADHRRPAIKVPSLRAIAAGLVAAAFAMQSSIAGVRMHDPVAYYADWGGYRHPVVLSHRITKDEADAIAAKGAAYLIGHFDTDGKLVRVVKLLGGDVFFEYAYAYHPNGRLRSARITRAGSVKTLEYDERGRVSPPR